MGVKAHHWPLRREDLPELRHRPSVRPAVRWLQDLLGRPGGSSARVAGGQRVLVAAQRLLGAESRVVRRLLCRAAASLEAEGREAEAVILLRSALARRPRAGRGEVLWRRRAELDLGRLLVGAGGEVEADERLTRVVVAGLREPHAGAVARDLTLTALLWLAELRKRQGRDGEARELLARAANGLSEACGPDDDETLTAELSLAEVELRGGDEERAVDRLRHVAETFGVRRGPDDEEALLARWHLAAALHRSGELLEARVVAAGVLEGKCRRLGADHEDSVAVGQLLAAIDEALLG